MGRIKKTFKSHVENMVTCGFSKSYKQFGSENRVIEESICSSLDISPSLTSSEKDSKMMAKSTLFGKKNNKIFCYNCSECGHKGTIKNEELRSKSTNDEMKDKLNNEHNNNKESSLVIRPKCDISTRKHTSDDALLSCIVVNNDLHGTNDENINSTSVNVTKAISGVKFSPARSNGTIDTLIRKGLLQLFNHHSNEHKNNLSCQNSSLTSSNPLQNKSLVTKNQRLLSKPYRKKSNSISDDRNEVRNRTTSKSNNLHRDSNKKVHVQNLSESSNSFKIKTQSSSLTLPLSLSNVLIPARFDTDCLWAKVTRTEEVQLRNAAWYQPGLSREIVTEVLSDPQLPNGTFLVRSSLTHPDSFALSIKVPMPSSSTLLGSQEGDSSSDSSLSSIAHYLIIASLSHGYRINGSVKSFPTLFSLIVHHSVMKEILPCTLNLSVAAEMTRRHFSLSNDTLESATTHSIKEEEVICDLLANEEDHEESKDVSDANYPDLLYTLRKALISSYSEEKHNLITLS